MSIRPVFRALIALGVMMATVAPSVAQEINCDLFPKGCSKTQKPPPEPEPSPSPEPVPPSEPEDPPPGTTPGGGETAPPSKGATEEAGTPRREQGPFAPEVGDGGRRFPFAFSGPHSTARTMALLARLEPYGIPVEEAVRKVVGPFPVAGAAWWMDDWHACRDGCRRFHQGLDIFAPHGTPLVATADGVVSQVGQGGLAGIFVEITDANATQYFYAHLSRLPPDLGVGQRVKVGEVVGYVGNTGNAIHTPPHVHFEYQPRGIPRPPKPLVDAWAKLAESRARALVEKAMSRVPVTQLGFRLTRLFDLAGEGGTGAQKPFLAPAGAVSSFDMGRVLTEMSLEIAWAPPAEVVAHMEEETPELPEALPSLDVLGGAFQAVAPEQVQAVFPVDGSD